MHSDGDRSAGNQLSILNPEPSRIPGPRFLHELVCRNGQRAIDYLGPDGTVSNVDYLELHEASDHLAQRIAGALPATACGEPFVVPILLPQSPDLYISQLAVLKAGGAFCPLNLDAPPERVKFILGDVSAQVLVTVSSLLGKVPSGEAGLTVIVLDDDESSGAESHVRTEHRGLRCPKPHDLAYVMYTSGSTGTPKGVGISHDAATQALLAHNSHIPHFSRFLQFAAPTFDVSVFEIFFPLFRGSTLVCCDRGTMLNDLPAAIRRMGVDACELTPTVAGSLLRKRENAPGLRLLLTIGEMLTEPVVKEFGGSTDRSSILWAMYGPTEATIHCTLQPAFHSSSGVGNIGIPLETVSCFILEPLDGGVPNPHCRVLSVGEVGELAVGGHQLANEYLNRPEQTAAAFIQSPYGRLYRTGDKARILPDGTMECLGRISDGQVKLRGQRIELGEIEQAILKTPGCHGAVASVIQGIIVAFGEVDDDSALEGKIQQSCRDWLPGFMVPGDLVLMTKFPRLPSGKVDRKLLKARYEESNKQKQEEGDERYGDPYVDDTERRLAELAQEAIGSPLNRNSILSASGMDSIMAIKYSSLLRKAGIDVSAVDVLASKSVSSLYSRIKHRTATHEDGAGEQVARGNEAHSIDQQNVLDAIPLLRQREDAIQEILPCTPTQEAMLAETSANPAAYCNWIELQLPEGVKSATVVSWFLALIQENQALRTGFAVVKGRFVQVVWKTVQKAQIQKVRRFDWRAHIENEQELLHPLDVQVLPSKSKPRVLVRLHHALYDGWSWDAILADLNELARGQRPHGRPQFRHVVDYYCSRTFALESDAARTFWAGYLLEFQPNPLPQLLPIHSQDSRSVSAFRVFDLSPIDVDSLSQQLQCSPQVFFQACVSWMWASIVGDDDVVIGSATSGRTIPVPGIEDVVGPCLTTTPLRVKFSQIRTVKELLGSIHASNRESLPYCTLPLAEVKKAAGILPGQRLYDVLFVYQESIHSRNRRSHLVRQVAHQDYLETKLLFEVEPSADGFECRLTHHLDSIHYAHVQHLLSQLQCLLKYVLSNLDAEIKTMFNCFPESLVSRYNTTPRHLEGVPDLAVSVQATAAQSPDKPALCFAKSISQTHVDSETVSYRELNALANKVARHLQTFGAAAGGIVLIVMEKSVLLYVSILGILKAGCAYLPLLPTTPQARIKTIVEQAGVELCIADTASLDVLQDLRGCRIIDIDKSDLSAYMDTNLNVPADPARVSNIIYTSGSTGVPKGVCVTQLNVVSNLNALSEIYPVRDGSRLLQSCSQAFDVSVFEIFFSWTRGMCLCSATNDTLFDDLEKAIRALEVTHLSMTPTVAALVHPANVPRVQFLVTSGEPMTEEVARRWVKQLYQGYGPSETTNICSVKKMGASDAIRHLGWTFKNTSAFVLEPGAISPVPYGCVGELCFGGDQVAQGYLNLPDLTAQKFIAHPKYGRLYRSGDLGRMLPDGSLIIIGRVDDQIKLRGQRVELGEITSTVAAIDMVLACTTLLVRRKDASTDVLASFYVPISKESPEFHVLQIEGKTEQIQASIYRVVQSKLPSYMVPSHLIPVSTVPIMRSGKIDRAKLREMFVALSHEVLEATGPPISHDNDGGEWSDTERKVAEVLGECLGVPVLDFRRWSPLTSVGLDSISAISVSAHLKEAFGKRVPVSAILQNASIAGLARVIAISQPDSVPSDADLDFFDASVTRQITARFEKAGLTVEKVLPCTPLQEAMLASSATDASYLNKMLFRLNVDPKRMRSYWDVMCQRHGILRTCFVTTDDAHHAIIQVVLRDWEVPWQSIDASTRSIDEAIQEHSAMVVQAIDTLQPPISCAILHAGQECFLSFICHHALYDGVAIEQLLFEIQQVASGHRLDPPPAYERFLKEIFALPESTDSFWRDHLSSLTPSPLPRAISTPSSHGKACISNMLDISLSKVERHLKSLNVSLLSLCQATWSSLLGILLRSPDVCFGNVVSGRSVPLTRVEELVAPCFNTIPVRINLDDIKWNAKVLRSFQNLNPILLDYQFTPLRRIQSLVGTEGRRLFDTLLILQQPRRRLDENLWRLDRDDGEMDLPLVCEVTPNTQLDTLDFSLHFDRSHLSDAVVSFIYDTLSYILVHILDSPHSNITSSSSLPASLRARLEDLQLHYPTGPSGPDAAESGSPDEWSDTETAVRSMLAKLSKTPSQKITRHTTIFQLGLDSINAVQIASMLRKQGLAVTATDVMEHPSCARLAARLDQGQQVPRENMDYDFEDFQRIVTPLLKTSVPDWDLIETVLPCTPLQVGMLTEFLKSEGKNYLNYISFQTQGSFRVDQFLQALSATVNMHAMLRVGFAPVEHQDSSFAMIQYSPDSKPIPLTDVVDNKTQKFSFEKWRLDAVRGCLSELHRPPWRAALVRGQSETTLHLAIHHAIYDATSLWLILSDLSAALQGMVLPSRPSTVDAVREILGQVKVNKVESKEFWEKRAADTVINNFPVLTPLRISQRAILTRSRTSSISFSALEKAVKESGFTIQALVQATWARVLTAYLGEAAVTFGVVLSGRYTEATRSAGLPCIATLPVITRDFSSNRDILEFMMSYNTELHRHQHTPLTDIARWVGHPNVRLFDTLLVYQKLDQDNDRLRWRVIEDTATIDYPLSIEIEPQGDSIEFRITFFDDVLPEQQANLLLRQFDATLCDLALHPDGKADELSETHLDLFAVTPAEEPNISSEIEYLHEFVEITALKQPDTVALEFVSEFDGMRVVSRQWTYKELDRIGNKVANMLSAYVQTGGIVAACFDKCPEAHFAMLGILKAGCALLALDPGAPASRREFILQDSGAAVLLTDRKRASSLDLNVSIPVFPIDEESVAAAPTHAASLFRKLTPSDRSYCLYTSGTTGTPKGCEITHENAVQAMLAFQKLFAGHWDKDSRWLQFASYHFDVSVLEQYWTWSVGLRLVAAPRDVILEDLAGMISKLQITHIDLTPSLARLIHPDEVPSLSRGVFITGGEQLKQEILDAWGPVGVIHNFYGPTEATIGVTSYPQVPINGRPSNIGRQFPNVGSYVLHPGTEIPVLRGGVGELCVSGKLVGKGYLNREDLTMERFPTLKRFNDRVYRTGDLVRILHDGCFDFLGRADDQVKLRGQRLEIGEINHCIKAGVSDINDVATLVIRNEKLQKDLLVSFVVTDPNPNRKAEIKLITTESASEICSKAQKACREKLPGYMVPTYTLQLPYIPLSPNNKAEIKELRRLFNDLAPEQLMVPSYKSSSIVAGEVAEKICAVLGNMMGLERGQINPSANIFEIGIDSISVLRLARGLKREGLTQATPVVILKNPTISDLAEALGSQAPRSAAAVMEARQLVEACKHRNRGLVCRALGITPEDIEYIAPCSPLQEGMISRSRIEVNGRAYFNSFHSELVDRVSLPRLKAAWEWAFDECSILRTSFVSTTDGYIQVSLKGRSLPWTENSVADENSLRSMAAERWRQWVDKNQENIERPVELHLVRLGDRNVLIIHLFHAIYDANSLDLLLDLVAVRYNDTSKPPAAPSFLDALVHGPLKNYGMSKEFWVKHLAGVSYRPLGPLIENPSDKHLSASRTIEFQALDRVRRSIGVAPQALVQAIWVSVSQRYFTNGVTVGVIVSGRSIELDNVEQVIGPLFNTIPYHHRYDQGETWSSAIRTCHDFNTSIMPFQHVPLRDVQKWCSGGQPLFDVLFSFQREAPSSQAYAQLWMEQEPELNPDYPLAFEATLKSDQTLEVLVVAQKGVANEDMLEQLLTSVEGAAKAIVQDVEAAVWPSLGLDLEKPLSMGTTIADNNDSNVPLSQATRASPFEWTEEATTIRHEMAVLADVDPDSVEANTSLLELGLDSIDTIKLSARLRKKGITLANSQLIKGQRISTFLGMLGERSRGDNSAEATSLSKLTAITDPLRKYLEDIGYGLQGVEQLLPPTPLQDSMVSEMIQSGFRRYFNHDVLELPESLDIARLKAAWETVSEYSPILRTSFVPIDSPRFDFGYCQVVQEDSGIYMSDVNIDSLDEIQNITERARERARMDDGKGNLLQVIFAKCQGKVYLVLSVAHALYDGWSIGLLHQDVRDAYMNRYKSRPQYSGYLADILQSSTDDARRFWFGYLSESTASHIPPAYEPIEGGNPYRAEATSKVSGTALKEFCRRHAVSMQVVGQACWAAVLAARCQSLDVSFGVVLSGRESEMAEGLLFPTMNTVAVRCILHGTVSSLLRYMQDNMSSISQFQHFPLRKILALAGNPSGGLFNSLFILQKSQGSATDNDEPWMKSIEGSSAVEYPVCVEMEAIDNSVIWRTACDPGFLSGPETAQLLHDLDVVLGFFTITPDADILGFREDGVSVCGLAAFHPRTVNETATNRLIGEGVEEESDQEWSPTEDKIRSVFSELSGVEPGSIQKSHSLYHLGLDSISAIKASSLLRKRGVVLSVRDMLAATSIREMAGVVAMPKAAPHVAPDAEAVTRDALHEVDIASLLETTGISSSSVEEVLPATAMQVHMVSVWQNTDGAVFFPEFRYRLSGIRHQEGVEAAWNKLAIGNPILRTTFVATSSRKTPLVQVVAKPDGGPSHLAVLDITEETPGTWILTLRIHHALYDGVSLPLIIDRFLHLLRDQFGTATPEAIADWKSFVSIGLSEDACRSREQFWTEYLQGASSSLYPLREPASNDGQSTIPSRVSRLERVVLPTIAALKSLSTKLGISIQSLFFAAYAKVLSSLTKDRGHGHHVVFGVYVANRSTGQDVETMPYPTLCLVPLKVALPDRFDIIGAAREVQRDLHQIVAPENAAAGLWEIKDWTGVQVDSFVNFLSLPDNSTTIDDTDEGSIRLQEVRPRDDDLQQLTSARLPSPRDVRGLEGNCVRDAYLDAVDVEVSVRGDEMDIGVFGSRAKLDGDEGARRLISSIVEVLRGSLS
ncbi:Hydroxamate-type ferrichrome siderophore peptide synthetase [Pleurostoma richardsiae]|uniref:Hydroxamate-type ferrichrome siderophore peptide synthetase n=1 Tax=Pleurostoma richardsiae TaxID=41990 RepID=A0AA38VEF1_9PEZI|nr:Hydroxamate-type ferrichrome siderophore peptide synthetase [Pleurostoma richardsiae]